MIEMLEQMPPTTELRIAAFERVNRLELPSDYRRFLLEQNGGRPKDRELPVPGWGVTVVDFFLGVGTVGAATSTEQRLPCWRRDAASRLNLP